MQISRNERKQFTDSIFKLIWNLYQMNDYENMALM